MSAKKLGNLQRTKIFEMPETTQEPLEIKVQAGQVKPMKNSHPGGRPRKETKPAGRMIYFRSDENEKIEAWAERLNLSVSSAIKMVLREKGVL